MFMQGDVSLERTQAGLGVGLTLVRNLVALHGGTVDVRSDGEGSGSEFTVSLPIDPRAQPAPAISAEAADRPAVRPLRILVADDNDDGREMLAHLLVSEGHTVEQAADGRAAVDVATTFRPDIIILDIGMPMMNGYAVARTLKQRPDMSSVVLVALSGLGQQEEKARAAAAGFDRHFTETGRRQRTTSVPRLDRRRACRLTTQPVVRRFLSTAAETGMERVSAPINVSPPAMPNTVAVIRTTGRSSNTPRCPTARTSRERTRPNAGEPGCCSLQRHAAKGR